MLVRLFPSRSYLGLVAGLCGLLAFPVPAGANDIDEGLRKCNSKIFAAVFKGGKYKNVGVLRFKVQQGDKEATFHYGELNKLMASRVGNMLILANNLKNPVGIIPNAADQAVQQDKNANWRTPAEREKLFTYSYQRPWKEANLPDMVQVDAFLTGEVLVSKDFQTTKVVIYLFDKKDTNLREIASFAEKMERSTLTDMDISFKVEKKNLKPGWGIADLNMAAAQSAVEVNSEPPAQPPYTDWIDFKVFYGEPKDNLKPVQIDKDVAANQWKLTPPTPGQKVFFRVVNRKKEPVAVVILVNGISTLFDEKDREKERYSRWVLEPGMTYGVYGFYPTPEIVKPFIVKAPGEAIPAVDFLDAEKYKIQVIVFAKGDDNLPADTPKVHYRGSPTMQASTLADMQVSLLAANKAEKKNLIVGGDPDRANLEPTMFEGIHQATGVIVYAPAGQ
jgi:hypothetical protein